jgi:mannose-6-phosphate isomerase-like protein (cupin superfamily)
MSSMSHTNRSDTGSSGLGQVFSNPITGEHAVILTDPSEHPDGVLVAHLTVRPGGRVALEHTHPTINERFHILSGAIVVSVDGREQVLGPGERAEIPRGARHDWWQTGDQEAQALVEVTPGVRFVEVVGTMWGLARDGRTGGRPMPGPLQMAVTASAYADVMTPTSPPPWVQNIVFSALSPIGRLLGRRPTYPQYAHSDEVVDPDPAALALLTADGRLAWE